jgi:hypothetical protein
LSQYQGQSYREPSRDYNALVYEALRAVNTSFASPEFDAAGMGTRSFRTEKSRSHVSLDRFEANVRVVLGYIQPGWIDKDDEKHLDRMERWAKFYVNWKPIHDEWRAAYVKWQGSDRDPMLEPIEPLLPEKPKPFLNEVKECWDSDQNCYQAFKLHKLIIAFLIRRDFFEKETEPEEFGSTEYPDEPTQQNDQNPTGSPATVTAGTRSAKL